LGAAKTEIFFEMGLDRVIDKLPVGQISSVKTINARRSLLVIQETTAIIAYVQMVTQEPKTNGRVCSR
jgi:hypothetical protein